MILPESFRLAARATAPVYMVAPNKPPYTTPGLTANLVLRVSLAAIANLVCLVPLRLLYRNGEIAAVIFIVTVELKNIFAILFALLWQNDDMESWWPGYGLCDFYSFFYNAAAGIYVTCLLAIMRNLAHQVGLLRANPLTVNEKRRRNLIQLLIIFPLPIVQMAFTYPLAAQRYSVGTLMGCTWVPSSSWPYIVFFVIAQPIIAVVTSIYAIITFWRFRQVAKITKSALSTNRQAAIRSQRTKRRLYLMVLSILVPFLPIIFTLCALNVLALENLEPFNFGTIHGDEGAMIPWASVTLLPSRVIDFGSLNNAYISIITAIPIFIFFGMTKDAMNSYRMVLLFCGFGKLWPSLYNEYDPDKSALRKAENSSKTSESSTAAKGSRGTRYKMSEVAVNRSISSAETAYDSALQASTFLTSERLDKGPKTNSNEPRPGRPHRNPFPFRTRLNLHLPLRLLGLGRKTSQQSLNSQEVPLQRMRSADPPSTSTTVMSGSLPAMPTSQWRIHGSEILEIAGNAPSALEKGKGIALTNKDISGNSGSSKT